MQRQDLAHSDQAEIGQIRPSVGVSVRQLGKLNQVLATVEREFDETFVDHGQDETRILEVERGFRQYRLTSLQWRCDAFRQGDGPAMVLVGPIGKCDEKAGVGDAFHGLCARPRPRTGLEKPLRDERSSGPESAPASRM
jgi:hypothetical protein